MKDKELVDCIHVDSCGRKDEDENNSIAVRLIRRPRKAECMLGARTSAKAIVYALISKRFFEGLRKDHLK